MIIILFVIITCFLFVNYKKTVLVYTPFKFLFTNSVILAGNITFENAISLLICLLFVYHYGVRKQFHYNKPLWPLFLSFLLMSISESISAIIGEPNYISIPLKVCRNYGYCIVLYYIVVDENDLRILLKSLFAYSIILVGNGIIQLVLDVNIIGDWVLDNLKEDNFFIDKIDYGDRGLRINSFLAHSICFGDVCAIFFFVFVYFYQKDFLKGICRVSIFVLLIGVVLANSRTSLLAMMIYVLPLLLQKEKILRYKVFYVVGLICFFLYLSVPMYQMLDSMFNENSKYAIGGSNMTMRLEQLAASFYVVRDSLWLGLGYSFDFGDIEELRGAESVWFNIIMYQGILGCLCYLFIIIQSIRKTRIYNNYRYILFMSLGYFLQQSSTYNAGLNEFLFYFCLVILITHSDILTKEYCPLVNNEIVLFENQI